MRLFVLFFSMIIGVNLFASASAADAGAAAADANPQEVRSRPKKCTEMSIEELQIAIDKKREQLEKCMFKHRNSLEYKEAQAKLEALKQKGYKGEWNKGLKEFQLLYNKVLDLDEESERAFHYGYDEGYDFHKANAARRAAKKKLLEHPSCPEEIKKAGTWRTDLAGLDPKLEEALKKHCNVFYKIWWLTQKVTPNLISRSHQAGLENLQRLLDQKKSNLRFLKRRKLIP